ncbi:hypothetical protein MHYP_G00314200 [Metynnis hypsauchen]
MMIDRDDYLRKEFDIKKSVPHVTLLVSEGYEQKHIGEMMAEAEEAVFLPVKENLAIWRSEDQRFIKIMITAQGQGQPQTVRMTHESICSVTMDSDPKREEMLRQVPECLWSRHSTDIGLVKLAQPVKVELRPGVKPPWKSQYPLKEEAIRGIERQIEGLLKAGVLKITQHPQSNTPLLPVKKPDGSYRLIVASAMDKQLWLDRSATQDSTGLWRSHEGLIIAPPDLLGLMIQEAHGLAHVARVEVMRKIMKEYGFWAPCLLEQTDYVIGRQRKEEVKEKLDEQKRSTVQPGDKVFVKVFRRKWYNERLEGPFEVVRSTGTAVQGEIFKSFTELFQAASSRPAPYGICPYPSSRVIYAINLMLKWEQTGRGVSLGRQIRSIRF